MRIELNTPESLQESSFQNATLHSVNEQIACSISITPKYPEHVKTQQQAADYLEKAMCSLSDLGWDIDVQIGLSSDYEDSGNPE
jgi:hypothetical protein